MIKSPRHKDTHGSSAFRRQDSSSSSTSSQRGQQYQEEASVSNLRKLYSSLLEELAPAHHELGTATNTTASYHDTNSNKQSSNNRSNINNNANYRWKNSGTITVEGADDTGYDYSYTPDNAVHSWRLGNLRSAQSATTPRNVNKKKGRKAVEGIMGGDWSKDGVRRYYTGGVTAVGVGRSGAVVKESLNDKKNEESTDDNVVADEKIGNEEVPSTDVDTVTVNDIQLDERFSIQDDDDDVQDDMFDVNILSPVPSVDEKGGDAIEKSENDNRQLDNHALQMPTLEPPSSSATLDKTPTKRHSQKKKQRHTAASIMRSSSSLSNDSKSPHSSPPKSPPPSSFESLYNITNNNAMTTWYVRSAYVPTTPYEKQLLRTSTTNNNSTTKSKAKSIMSGNNQAQNSQVRICHTLKRIAEILCISERRKGRKFIGKHSHYLDQSQRQNSVTMVESSSEDEEELEVSEAVFAYFCEKNVLPLLIDSFLTRPDALTVENQEEDDEDDEEEWWNKDKQKDTATSLFSGVAWTAAVKSRILQTIAMLLLNTTSPLSLAYLLSNNYMNELIMGMLPLSQWKEEALEEMLPPFVTLLRGLVMKLRGEEGRGLIPLLMCQRSKMGDGTEEEKESETYLPLLYAAIEVFCYTPGSLVRDADGCMVRTTAMNAILNLCRVTSPDVRAVFVGEGLMHESLPCTTKSAPPPNTLSSMLPSPSSSSSPISLPASFPNATIEQHILFPFICSNINKCYHRSVRLMMTSISLDKSSKHDEEAKAEATQRHVDLASTQFSELQYWLGFLDDLLSCEIRVWNVRLVEWIMREVVVGTILLHWIRALKVVGMTAEDEGSEEVRKKSVEYCKAKAEVRVSIVFLTQLFAMVSYRPLIRLAGAALLHPKYPIAWCGDDDDNNDLFCSSDNEEFFQVTPIINAIVSKKESKMDGGDTATTPSGGEEADAGAGVKDGAFVPSLHRASLLEMLSGDETIIASMLFGTILENDALDDNALEKLGVLPSPNDDVQFSQFEEALANFLLRNTVDHPDVESRQLSTSPRKYKRPASSTEAGGKRKSETLSVAVEFVSSLGLMLMERIIFHTWTEGGECLDVVPFDHYYKSSLFIQALSSSLTYFSSYAQSLAEGDSLEDYFKEEFNRRYVSVDASKDSIHTVYNESNVKMACYIQNYHPSNFIDDANVLLQSSGPPSTESAEEKATKCAIRLILHLRSLVGCIEEFYSRFTTISGNRSNALTTKTRWYGEAEALSFCTIEEADELLLSIGGVQTTRIPDVGTEIDLRGRKSFPCSSQNMHKRRRADRELILVVDPTEIFIARCKKGDINRCIILAVVPLSKIIASASAGEILHIVCPLAEVPTGTEEGILKDGRMSLRLSSVNMCLSVKEYLDKYCTALENRAAMDINELLEKCVEVGINNSTLQSSSKRREVRGEESWADFQQA